MADPGPAPDPTPFPIKIVADSTQDPSPDSDAEGSDPSNGKRNDDFYPAWKKFLKPEPKRAKATSRAAAKIDEVKDTVKNSASDGLATRENAATSYEQAAAECRVKVAAIVDECQRLNQKYRDVLFDLESDPYTLQNLEGRFPGDIDQIDFPPWVKRVEDIFDKPQFYIDGATANDVHQGNDGDCWFLASLMAVSAKKELIDRLCVVRDEIVGVYGFVFFRDGEWIYEVIDDKLFLKVGDDDDLRIVKDWDVEKKDGRQVWYDDEKLKSKLQRGGEALYFSHCKSNETWLPLIEKAYAKAHGDYYSIEGGYPSEGIEDLTGGVGVVLNPEDIMDKERFWREQLSQVNEKYLFGGSTKQTDSRGMVGSHAYAVLKAWGEGDLKLLKIRNPWGRWEWNGDWSDGSKLWTAEMMTKLNHTFGDDGVFWMSYKDFLKYFPSIHRVRLFDSSWSVAQQWTSVNVPWTVDYLDTKFQFTVAEKGPVVIVLCQPDDRYLDVLSGRYVYSMHFRVYKEGEDTRWIVRSMHNSGNWSVLTRSVSAEIGDLEPGTYDIVFKVTAVRQSSVSTAEEVITKYALDRKEKLLSVGRRFDYAQSKGNLRGLEASNLKARKQDLSDKEKGGWKKDRKINQQERERARKRKRRVDNAIRDNRKEYDRKVREREERRSQRKELAPPKPNDEQSPTVTAQEIEKRESVAAAPDTGEDQTPAPNEPAERVSAPAPVAETADPVAESLSNLSLRQTSADPTDDRTTTILPLQESDTSLQPPSQEPRDPATAAIEPDVPDSDSDSEPPLEPPIDDLEDDDFEWDSDIDGPVFSPLPSLEDDDDDDDDGPSGRDASPEQESAGAAGGSRAAGGVDLFADDPWNAMCVLGLRVYSKSAGTRVRVVKAEGEGADNEQEEGGNGGE